MTTSLLTYPFLILKGRQCINLAR